MGPKLFSVLVAGLVGASTIGAAPDGAPNARVQVAPGAWTTFDADRVGELRKLAESYKAKRFGFYAGKLDDRDPVRFRIDGGRLLAGAPVERGATYWVPFGLMIDGVRVEQTAGVIAYVGRDAEDFAPDGAGITCPSSSYWACCWCGDDGRAWATCVLRTAEPQQWNCHAGGIGASQCEISGCREIDPEAVED